MSYINPKQSTAIAFDNLKREEDQPIIRREYPTCDNCDAKLQKRGESFKCTYCGWSRLIEPGELLGY